MNLVSWIVLLLVLGGGAFVIFHMIRKKRAGQNILCNGCDQKGSCDGTSCPASQMAKNLEHLANMKEPRNR